MLVLACSLREDYSQTSYRCSDGRCPPGFVCQAGRCGLVGAPGPSRDATPADAARPLDGALDAPRPDAARLDGPRVADGAFDLCARGQDGAAADTCGAAPDLGAAARAPAGVTVYGDTSTGADHLSPAIIVGCTGSPEPGNDAFYRLDLAAGERVRATLATGGWDGALYLVRGCTMTAACVGGSDALGTDAPEQLDLVVTTPGVHYLVVDANLRTAHGCYALTLRLGA